MGYVRNDGEDKDMWERDKKDKEEMEEMKD